MELNNTIFKILNEQSVLKTTKTKPIVDAIKNRKKINFFYTGPQKPKKDSVKSGKRYKVEPVAIGLSKKGNLVIRAWVEPPSVSKKGFDKTNWRTFMVGRMTSVEITDETFDNKRPNYKEGNDKSMSVTYVTSDWTRLSQTKTPEKPVSRTQPTTPEKPTELPQPKAKEKPAITPDENIKKTEIFNNLKRKIKSENNNRVIDLKDFQDAVKQLYKVKEDNWITTQTNIGGNTRPGEGTRNKFNKSAETDLKSLMDKENIKISGENISESINRIKTLMLL
jgi:hypothetical protein